MDGPVDGPVDGRVDGPAKARHDSVLVGGPEGRPVVIAEPDPAWPQAFERERARIAAALGARALRIDHVGSTAVPGLAAKPIIDVQVSVEDPADDVLARALEDAGYHLRVREPGHRMFRTEARDVHVHLWPAGSDDERRTLVFRDWLRADAADRARYAAEKRALARRHWPDMNDYAEAKTPVVEEIMARAESWAAARGWRPDATVTS